jgi:hypothetical protein
MVFLTPHTQKATSLVVWQTGLLRAKMVEMAEVEDNNIIGIIEVRSIVIALLRPVGN